MESGCAAAAKGCACAGNAAQSMQSAVSKANRDRTEGRSLVAMDQSADRLNRHGRS
jgi:hypothetical protein